MKAFDQTTQLTNLRIAAPCNKDWNSMPGDERVRFCNACSKNVYNISAMTSSESESFLRENGVSKCMRIFRRADGTVITDNCPVGLRKIRNGFRRIKTVVASTLSLWFSVAAASAQNTQDQLNLDISKVITTDTPIEIKPRNANWGFGEMGEFKTDYSIDLTIPEDAKTLKTVKKRMKTARVPKDFERAIAYQQAGDLQGAIDHYERGLATDNDYTDSGYTNLAVCLISRDQPGDRERALHMLEKLKQQNPKNGNIHFCLGMLHEKNQDLDEAVRAYDATIRLQPMNLRAVQKICELCAQSYSKERFLMANSALRQALGCDPPDEVRAVIWDALSKLSELPNKQTD